MKALWNNQIIAESNDTIIIEGNHYFPPKSVNKKFLKHSETKTNCPWKGKASYYDIVANNKTNQDTAWFYNHPKPTALEIVKKDFSGYIAFWRGVEITD
jgi:uncharacterized protein (DUF427 family)